MPGFSVLVVYRCYNTTYFSNFCFFSNSEEQVQRIQTALALYTNDLCGTVLLTHETNGVSKSKLNVSKSISSVSNCNVRVQLYMHIAHSSNARYSLRRDSPKLDVLIK